MRAARQALPLRPSAWSKAPTWNAPSAWIPFSEIDRCRDIKDCLYIWHGRAEGRATTYLYVGIVGDTRAAGQSKRTLTQRLKEEEKQYFEEYGVHITEFRYAALNDPGEFPVPELLKTIEMSEITVLSSLFACENARDNITALFESTDIVLLNSMTSYKYVN